MRRTNKTYDFGKVLTMTSYDFMVAAKNAVIDYFKKTFDKKINIQDLEIVWFAHELGFKKCTIWGRPMDSYYAEITYNKIQDEIYLDVYKKVDKMWIRADGIDTTVHYD